MSRDAKFFVWAGVRSEGHDIRGIASRMQGADVDCDLETIKCCDEPIGFGIVVFSHDWDYGNAPFNAASIQREAERARSIVEQVFDNNKVDAEVGVWCQSDFR